jgi:hypothetical protein
VVHFNRLIQYDKQIPKSRNEEIEGIGEAQYLNNDLDWMDEEE